MRQTVWKSNLGRILTFRVRQLCLETAMAVLMEARNSGAMVKKKPGIMHLKSGACVSNGVS